jgi:PAS domain S-box-containing protein
LHHLSDFFAAFRSTLATSAMTRKTIRSLVNEPGSSHEKFEPDPNEKMQSMKAEFPLEAMRTHALAEASKEMNQKLRLEIAEHERTESALNRLTSIIEFSNDAIFAIDLNHSLICWNTGAEKMFGFTAEEIQKLLAKEKTVLPKGTEEQRQLHEKIMNGESIKNLEMVRPTKDGRLLDIELNAFAIRDATGTIVGYSAIARDITERKQAEIALNRLAAIVEYSSDAIIGKDLNSIVTSWNKGAEKIFGFTSGEMVGASFMRLIPEDRRRDEGLILGKIRRGETLEHFETVRKTKDGRLIDVSVTVSPIKDSSGRIIGASKIARDITDVKRAKEMEMHLVAVMASNLKLEVEISRRQEVEKELIKSERHQKQLQQRMKALAKKLLHIQEEERLRISRELHDQVVQTLIGINIRLVIMSAQAAGRDPDFQRQLILTQQLVKNSVDDVHQVARDLRDTALDDLGLTRTLNGFLKTFGEETGIRAYLTVFDGVDKLDNNILTTLYRITLEALHNVAKHSKANEVEIQIGQLTDQVCLTIRDNGQGLQADPIEKAKRDKRLGIIGMQERLEILGGTFEIHSVGGQGTKVTARIPIGEYGLNKRG